jgi:predicted MFS family arabinose efflux permease
VSSLGSPLIPTIATDYGVSIGTAQWSLTLPLLMGAVSSPVVGRLGDGPRRLHVLLASLAVVTIGSVLAALPGSFAQLLIGRSCQGVGLALLPLVMGVARDHLGPDRARTTLATLSVTTVVGIGLGYPVTGVIAEHLSFHAAFWLAAILGTIAFVASAFVVPTSAHHPMQPFDLLGAVLLGLGLGGLLVSISEGEQWGWTTARLLGLAIGSLALIAIWLWHEIRTDDPIVDLRIMRHGTVLTANVTGLLAGVGMYMLMSMTIRYVQTPTSYSYGLGASVVVAGLVLLPMSAASFFASRLVTYVTRWIKPDRMLPLGVLIFAAALLLFATSRSHLWEIFLVMGIVGLAIGSSFAVVPRMIVSAVPAAETGSALALNQVLRTVGYSIGSALSAAVLTAHTYAPSLLPTNRGYTVGAIIAMLMCVITAIISWVLPARSQKSAGDRGVAIGVDEQLLVDESADGATAGILAYEPGEPISSRAPAS